MTILRPPRPPLVDKALTQARTWCAGHVIDDRPALVHAVRVAVTLGQHVPGAPEHLVAAALLHDAPELASTEVPLDRVLAAWFGVRVRDIVRALEVEHHALDGPNPIIDTSDREVLLASTADKIVAISSLLRRARASGDVDRFFAARPALLGLLGHFGAFADAGVGIVPPSMTTALRDVLVLLDRATAHARAAAS
ncbi:metal-dependent phosphohydrolase [Longispora fulva]|uniref:HD domain-containing protein n=1 Tax=Longispora fulva TaxID=619741 RepID=A0A8J7GCF8_9ACTN|nr:metal-dependent phosphohydrolase [Longispora fulva]MBG6136044.1 hypothetical protein [Longispora fulva]